MPSMSMLRRLRIALALLCVFLCTPVSAVSFYNATIDHNDIVCLFPISGQYALLHRLNYYLILLFAALAPRSEWLVGGAFAAAMTSAGIAAIHAIILASVSRTHRQILDLDVFGTWCILSTAIIVFTPMMGWSYSLRDSSARPILRLWGLLVFVGVGCSFIAFSRAYTSSPPCIDVVTGQPLESPAQFVPGKFNCTYSCFSAQQPLRSSSEILAVPKARVFGSHFYPVYVLAFIILLPIFLGLFTSCFGDPKRLFNCTRRRQPRLGGPAAKTPLTSYVAAIAFPPLLILTVTFNELYLLLQPRIPVAEEAFSVGQWGTWVATALVLFAGLVEYFANPREAGGQRANHASRISNSKDQRHQASEDLGAFQALAAFQALDRPQIEQPPLVVQVV